MSSAQQRFEGEICGFGTASGCRIVVGRWTSSPFGPFADAMVEHADGRRVLVAPDERIAELVGGLYAFDELCVGSFHAERSATGLRVESAALHAVVHVGSRDALGWCLRAVPRPIATSRVWATVVDPVARVVLRGVRTHGSTPGGQEYYAATDRHRVTAVEATWEGSDLGELRDVHPPVRFGFSSTPRRPSIVRVTTTVIPA